jgi:hypothetical protein
VQRAPYNRNKPAKRSIIIIIIIIIIMGFELKEIKNKAFQPDTVRYQVWREYGRRNRLDILRQFTHIKQKLTEEEEKNQPDSKRPLLFEQRQYIFSW